MFEESTINDPILFGVRCHRYNIESILDFLWKRYVGLTYEMFKDMSLDSIMATF